MTARDTLLSSPGTGNRIYCNTQLTGVWLRKNKIVLVFYVCIRNNSVMSQNQAQREVHLVKEDVATSLQREGSIGSIYEL